MSVRKNGIYSTAYWDDLNQKAHFVYDKYSCDTTALPRDVSENMPLFFKNSETSIEYYFFPDLVALESDTMVTNVAKQRMKQNIKIDINLKNNRVLYLPPCILSKSK